MKPSAASRRRLAPLICLAIALSFALPVSATAVTLHTYRTGIDTDNETGTGCSFSLGAVAPGALPGFELQVTVVVDNDLVPPAVVSAQVETCAGGVFGSAQALPGFVLELDSGLLGSDSVIGSIPLGLLGDAPAVRMAHHALSAGGSQDALFTTDGTPDGRPIVVRLATPASPAPLLNQLGIGLLLLLLIAVAWPRLRRRRLASALAVLAIVAGAVVAYAVFGDPSATDDQSDSNPSDTRAEIFAAFTMVGGDALMVRLDIEDIPVPMENCADAIDNDSDEMVDCVDPDCNGQTCTDGNPCTDGDTCSGSVCVASLIDCNDDNACTADVCDAGACVYSPIACEDSNACTADSCDASAGCVFTPLPCDDSNACTLDSCDGGMCINAPIACDDSNDCTADSCDPNDGCVYTPIDCDDNNACTEDTCETERGCVHMPIDCDP